MNGTLASARSRGAAWLATLALGFPLFSPAAEPWTLQRAIPFALTNSPDARVAQHRIVAAQAGLQQANAAFLPHLQANASYLRTDNPMLVFGAALNQHAFNFGLINDVPDADHLNVNGTITMPLYAGGRLQAGRQAAQANTEVTRQQAEAIQQQLAFEVARAFFSVHKTREFIRATEAAVGAFESNLGIATKRFNTGTALKHEVLDVEVRLAQAREDLVRARNANALALRALRNLLGWEETILDINDDVPPLALPAPDEKPVRPELIAASWATRAAEARVRQARSGHRPQVGVFGRYDYDSGRYFDDSGDSYSAGVHVQWDLWDGDLTRARVKEARAALEAAREEERKVKLAVDLEIEQARLNVNEAAERLTVTGKSVEQAAESAQLTRARFEQGLALATQVIDAETALTAARVRRAEAEADRQVATGILRKALGLPQIASGQAPP